MDDGVIQFFVISLFVVFSILESVARKNKAKAARRDTQSGPAPDRIPADTGSARGTAVPDAHDEPSRPRNAGLAGLLSQDFWEEVAALTQDDEVGPADEEEFDAPEMLPVPTLAAPVTETHWEAGLRQARTHDVVHYQDDPEVAPTASPGDGVWADPSTRKPTRPYALRGSLFGSTVGDLRRAVVLYEVLGPPLALRDEAQGRNG